MASILKPEISIGLAAATATIVYAVYSQATPPMVDVRAAPPGDDIVEGSRKGAAWMAAGLVAGISLLSKDPTVFVIGGGMVVAMDWWTRHSIVFDPKTGKASSGIRPTASEVVMDFPEGVGTY